MKKYFILLFFICFILLVTPKLTYAVIYFQDDFNGVYSGGWNVINNSCTYNGNPAVWELVGGRYGIKINGGGCTTNIVPNIISIPNGIDYLFKVDVAFTKVNMDRNFIFKFNDLGNWYGIHSYENVLSFEKVVGNNQYFPTNWQTNYTFEENQTYHFKIKVTSSSTKIYINNKDIVEILETNPKIENSKIALRASAGAVSSSEVWFDNVMVCSLDDLCGEVMVPTETPTPSTTETPTPTPTPTNTPTLTPTPTPIIPVIVIPGHGACFNHEAIIEGKENVPQDQWHLWPFVHEYDGIVNSIHNSGYQLNKDLFLFCYDWRKKIDQTADVLKNYIQNKVLLGRSDVNEVKLVGHSLGGLVGRSFAQKYDSTNLERLVTVGSPHEGAVQSYYAWEGGEPPEKINLGWFAWQILIQTQKRGFTTNIETIRNVAPSTLDLFPTFNFLKQPNGSDKNFRSMIWKNDWLYNLNNLLPDPPFLDKGTALIGEKGDTPAQYKIINRNWLDELLGRWEDGKPTDTLFENGDLTILEKSAQIPGESPEALALNHGELVRKELGIRKILQLLNIPEVSIEEGAEFKITPSLLFLLGSPANIQVIDPDSHFYSGGEDKLVFIPNPKQGNYNLQIIPNGSGNFKLFVSQQTENKNIWNEIKGTLNGTPISYLINFNPDNPSDNPIIDNNGLFYLNFAKEKILLLKKTFKHIILGQIINQIDETQKQIKNGKYNSASQKILTITQMVFNFRLDNSLPEARNTSFEAIEFLTKAYEITTNNSGEKINQKSLQSQVKATEKSIQSTEKMLQNLQKLKKLKPNNGVSFELASEQFAKAKEAFGENNFALTKILLSVVKSLLQESLTIL